MFKDLQQVDKCSEKLEDGKIVNINRDDKTMLRKRKPESYGESLGDKKVKQPTTLIEDKLKYYEDILVQIREKNKTNGEPQFNEILGYMPLRGDFDVEYDNDAELFLAEMEFNEDDTEDEIEMKRKILEIYNKR